MDKKFGIDCQILFPGAESWELWCRERGQISKVSTFGPDETPGFQIGKKSIRILALPVSHQVAFPFLSNAMDSDGLVQTARMHIERQGAGFDSEGILVEPVFGDPPNTVARIDAPVQKMNYEPNGSLPDIVVPAATILPLPKRSIAIWEELGDSVIAFEKNGKTIYYDKLSKGRSTGAELNRLQYQLLGGNLIDMPESLSIWGERFREELQAHPLFAGIDERPAPANVCRDYSMKPAWFRNEAVRIEQKDRKTKRNILVSVFAVCLVVVGAAALTVNFIEMRKLNKELAKLAPSAARISTIKGRWEEIATAVDPGQSYLETWRSIFSLPAINGVEITKLDISREGIEIIGKSKNPKLALKFIDDVRNHSDLSEFEWEYKPPEIDRTGTAEFELKGNR
ncbi:MAG: hypothetical protein P1V20_27620 [Verrucomicrobiales bacterium]|nr:hypothetical protein [Verrucomicrobiales bacterium]